MFCVVSCNLLLHIGIGWILGIILYVGAELHGQIEFLL